MKIDKSEWRPGPWVDEPDEVEWEHAGLTCRIARGPVGHLCGYVALPDGHPMHGVDYDDVRLADGGYPDVHGGLTYADGARPSLDDAGPEGLWWIGFDCAHMFDYTAMKWAAGPLSHPPDAGYSGTYRDIAYVRERVQSLAEQLVVPP